MERLLSPNNRLIIMAQSRRRRTRVPVACILVLLVLAVSTGSGVALTYGLLFPDDPRPAEEPALAAAALVAELVLGFGPILLFLWLWLKFFERRPFLTLGLPRTSGAIGEVLRGVFFGVLFMTAVVVVMAVLGHVAFERGGPDPEGFGALGGILFVALGWTVQGSAEEILYRGWLLQTVASRYGSFLGVLISSLAFLLSHVFSLGLAPLTLANLFLAGVFYAFYALHEGSLWGVCALHAAMNWAEGNLFGFDYYGNEAPGGVLLNLKETGPDIVTGGGVGFNTTSGLAYTAVLFVGLATIVLFSRRRMRAQKVAAGARG
jgi:membrane protease YdiL (CAAX protease family)